jgi:hypothetical protein
VWSSGNGGNLAVEIAAHSLFHAPGFSAEIAMALPSTPTGSRMQRAGPAQNNDATKLRDGEIAYILKAVFDMEDRGFTPEFS